MAAADPYRHVKAYFSPGRDCVEVTTGFFDRTVDNLDSAYYTITHGEVVAAAINAAKKGLKGVDGEKGPRLIVDKGEYDAIEEMRNAVKALIDAGWRVKIDNEAGLMHDKCSISDFRKKTPAVITGSFNPTKRAEKKNRENLVRIRVKRVVADYHQNFEAIWATAVTVGNVAPPTPPAPAPPAPSAPTGGSANP